MAVSIDAQMTTAAAVSNSTAINGSGLTVGAGASLITVHAIWAGTGGLITSPAATWNSSSMTLRVFASRFAASYQSAGIFTLASGETGFVTGNKTINVTWTGNADCYLAGASFSGTDTATGINLSDTTSAVGDATASTIAVTCATGDASLAVYSANGADPTVGGSGADTGPIKIWGRADLNPCGAGAYALGGTTDTYTFSEGSGNNKVIVGMHVIAATSAANPFIPNTIIELYNTAVLTQ